MRFALVTAATLMAATACSQTLEQGPRQSTAPPSAEIIDQRELLVLTSQPEAQLTAQVRRLGYEVTRIERLSSLQETLIYLRIPEGQTIPDAITEVEALQPGITAGANHAYSLQARPGSSDFANEIIGWPPRGCPSQRDVGLIDAGVASEHPGLGAGRIVQAVFHASDQSPRTNHGDLMADLLIGKGRLNGGTLFSANVVDPERSRGDVAGVGAILRAVDWLASEGVDLVNISLAGPFNKLLDRGLGTASAGGLIFVAAAGNIGPNAAPQYPAAFPFVLAVTAVDRDLAIYRNAVRGDHIDFAAPGVDIVLETFGGTRVVTGTSAATPYVTAIVAADQALSDLTSVEGIRSHLLQSAKDLGPVGYDNIFGNGLITAFGSCAN